MGEFGSTRRVLLIGAITLAATLVLAGPAKAKVAAAGTTFPVSWLTLDKGEVPGGQSGIASGGLAFSRITDNGRFVLFTSMSTNLGPSGANPNNINLFRKDMQTGNVVLVNRLDGKSGASTPGGILLFDMSANGNLVIMVSDRRLTAGDADDETDLYLRNIQAGTTTLISPGTAFPVGDATLSADGAYAVFTTRSPLVPGDVNVATDVYRYRIANGAIDIVSRIPALPNAGNQGSVDGSISGDGRWVTFSSAASNLIPGFVDNNGGFARDTFVRDMTDGVTYLVSSRFNSSTQGGNGEAYEPQIAGTPEALASVRVAFTSSATDLSDNGVTDPSSNASIYFKQMPNQASGLISRASGPAGENADSRAHTPSISNNGSRIVFSSDAGNLGAGTNYYGVYVRDRSENSTALVSARNEYAIWGQISGNGTSAIWSEAGGGTPDSDRDLSGVFRRNIDTGKLRLVSKPKGEAKVRAPGFVGADDGDTNQRLSANGRYWVFTSYSNNLPRTEPDVNQVYRRDLATGRIEIVSRANGVEGAIAEAADGAVMSTGGNFVAFSAHGQLDPADTNDDRDIYLRDVAAGTTTLISRADGANGAIADRGADLPSVSADGNIVVFTSEATNLGYPGPGYAVYVRDVAAGKTTIVSRASGEAGALANGSSSRGEVSDDGTRILFSSSGNNLSPADLLVSQSLYLRDRTNNETLLVSRAPGLAGASLPGFMSGKALSPDGSKVAFVTDDEDAVPATAPWPAGVEQVVVRTIADGTNVLGSSSFEGQPGNQDSEQASLSGDGNLLAFTTVASNLRTDVDVTGNQSVVVKDLSGGSLSGPPLFGDADAFFFGSEDPTISPDGNCLVFSARGSNAVSGDLGAGPANYMYVRSGTCADPKPLVPKLTAVSLKPGKFRVGAKPTAKASKRKRKVPRGTKIRFRLNTRATVRIRIDRKAKGRKLGKKCVRPKANNKRRKACRRLAFRGKLVRRNLAPGKRIVRFSGRIGRKALKPGRYRMVLRASGPGGVSPKVYRSFRVVRR